MTVFFFSLTTIKNQFNKSTGALYDVCNSDALSLLEQEVFDRVYSLVR